MATPGFHADRRIPDLSSLLTGVAARFSGDLRDLRLVVRSPKEALRTVHLPPNVSLEVLLIEIGAGIFFFYFPFFLFLAAVATQVLVGTLTGYGLCSR